MRIPEGKLLTAMRRAETVVDIEDLGDAAIRVLEQTARGTLAVSRVRRALATVLLLAALAAVGSVTAAVVIADDLTSASVT